MHLAEITYFNNHDVSAIKCGTYQSYVRTDQGQHFLFGDNEFKECLVFVEKEKIYEPHLINDIVKEKLNNKVECIVDVFLGSENTTIICKMKQLD